MASSTKPEVHDVLQSTTEPWPQAVCKENWLKFWNVVSEVQEPTQIHTDIQARWSVLLLLLFFWPRYSIPKEWKNYAMQYKKVQKSSWNEPYSSSSFTKQSFSKMAVYTAESERRVAEIKSWFLCRRQTDQQARDRVSKGRRDPTQYYYYYYYGCQKQISLAARGPDLRQWNRRNPWWGLSWSAVQSPGGAGIETRSRVDLQIANSTDDQPRVGSSEQMRYYFKVSLPQAV